MKKTMNFLRLSFFCALAAVSASCSQDELLQQRPDLSVKPGGDGETVVQIAATVTDNNAETRASVNLNASSFSAPAQSASIWVQQLNSSETAVGSYRSFKYNATDNSTTLTLDGSSEAPYFYPGGKKVNVYGWYPYNNHSTTFTVSDAQSTDANYNASDLMLANVDQCERVYDETNHTYSIPTSPTDKRAKLTFNHAMAKIYLQITNNTGANISTVTLKNVKLTAEIDVTNPSSLSLGSASGAVSDIIVYSGTVSGDANAAAVFPPQEIRDVDFIEITTTTGTITYKLDATGKTFEGGNSYTVPLNINDNQVGHTFTITDWVSNQATPVIVRQNNQITLSGYTANLDATSSNQTTTVTVNDVKGTVSVITPSDNPSTDVTVSDPTGSGDTRSITVTANSNATPGTYRFIVEDLGSDDFSASSAVITVTVVGNSIIVTAPEDLTDLKYLANKGVDCNSIIGYYVYTDGTVSSQNGLSDKTLCGYVAYVSSSSVFFGTDNKSQSAFSASDKDSRRIIVLSNKNSGFSVNWNNMEAGSQDKPSGSSDWFIPTKSQMEQFTNVYRNPGGITSGVGWSSTERSSSNAWYYLFHLGRFNDTAKTGTVGYIVRPCFAY